MNNTTQKQAAKEFSERWAGRGYEKGESQSFWIDLLQNVYGLKNPTEHVEFEVQVKLKHTSFIDAYIRSTKVLIEQKSIDKDLKQRIKQSDGQELTPFEQAKRYVTELPYEYHPRWIIVSNFKTFLIHDMNHPQDEPFEILLENLDKEYHNMQFLVDDSTSDKLAHEMEVSIKAGDLVGKLYNAFLEQYKGEATKEDLHALNVLCVRLVFCLYAEDAGVFAKDQFYHYLRAYQPSQMRGALKELFAVLDTPVAERDRFLEPELAAFPYVNGSLFKQHSGESIPPFTPSSALLLLDKASIGFDWSEISPTIFGAVFESTLNPETRRSGGMHYTSIENIHKVIDPLFMDELNDEFTMIMQEVNVKKRKQMLTAFQDKMASLKFLDPACGSGNFLTETYVSLRRLENKVISELTGGQAYIGFEEVNPIKVSIHQFYGIEINDFAVTVATTALWIAEAQMMAETERIIKFNLDYLPLKSYSNIREGNALRIDWEEVVAKEELSYIIGNPPFVGARMMSKEQKDDALEIFGKKWKNVGNLDYVACWYKKAADMMQSTKVRTALVSTNSISQGEQVANLWKPLMEEGNVHIDYAWRTFRWDSESSLKAHVHCVIIGFSVAENKHKRKLFTDEGRYKLVDNINGYLFDGESAFVESRPKPLCEVPEIGIGNKPIDGGYYLFTKEEMLAFIDKEPASEQYFKKWYGAVEFINNKDRYCLWLGDCSPLDLKKMPECYKRVLLVREYRLSSPSEGTRRIADKPTRFHVENIPDSTYILLPQTSSINRRYIPIGFLTPDVLCSNAVRIIPNASIYHFGILMSCAHMAWVRAICGRMKSDYQYSGKHVYNNFPWPTPTDSQKSKIEKTAQSILDARALYPDSSLADLYDEVTMPPELRKAHRQNDQAVLEAYGFPTKDFAESDCVAKLLQMYKELVG